MKIETNNCNFEREPLLAPFGFKGGYITDVWQSIVKLIDEKENIGLGLATQSTLWSDAKIFSNYSEATGNGMMFLITSYAAKIAKDTDFKTPIELLEKILPDVYEYGKKVTDNPELRLTFALNALVAFDNAVWMLYAKEKGTKNFDELIPEDIKPALSSKEDRLINIPLMSYNVPLEKIIEAVKSGYFLLKIKVGADPDKDGSQEKMLEWDKQRIKTIHEAVRDFETPYTEQGWIPYYLDANGRYDSKDRLLKLLDFAESIGARERIIIMEEPFPEEYKVDVSDIPVRLAADESAHSDKDALERIRMGYKAIALKPIAKTMSMSLKIAKLAYENDVPCFCADLTVNPILVDWNKTVAARLKRFPGLKIGLLESNGHQNYKNWEQMKKYHPSYPASWIEPKNGIFTLDDEFYKTSGGIFDISEYYLNLVGGT